MKPSVRPAMSNRSRLGEMRKPSTAAEEDDPGRDEGFDGSIHESSIVLFESLELRA